MIIEELRMKNYRQFREENIIFNSTKNIFIGENGSGKSSLLEAIQYVISGSYSMIERSGIESLFNVFTIKDYMESNRKYEDLPILEIEIFIKCITDTISYEVNGEHNSKMKVLDGLKMTIKPDDNYGEEIKSWLCSSDIFPFDFYKVEFKTFSGKSYNSFSRYKDSMKYLFVDSTVVNSNLAMKNYIKRLYMSRTDEETRKNINADYRQYAKDFSINKLKKYDLYSDEDLKIELDTKKGSNFENSITVVEERGIDIRDLGKGEAIFINTKYSLDNSTDDIDIVLLEEPENHLSYLYMHQLIELIKGTRGKQIFISTHSNMIASRLNLNNAIFLKNSEHIKLSNVSEATANYFYKSSNSNLLNFILAEKAILVEGDSEYILLSELYYQEYGEEMYKNNITMINCNGLTFKRYLDIAKELNMDVAIITDNDKDYDTNITSNYKDYISNEKIFISAPKDNGIYTFEVAIFNDNQELLEKEIETSSMVNGVLEYMLNNKTDFSLRMLEYIKDSGEDQNKLTIPDYIYEVFQWIR